MLSKKLTMGLIILAISLFLLVGCGGQEEAEHAEPTPATADTAIYDCPMNCEKGKTYDKPGECPVCKMALAEKKK